jgi:hypothetical protein
VYPAAAKGSSESDSGPMKAYYGPSISNWCVGQVKDFSFVFSDEVSNVWRTTITKVELSFRLNFCRFITGHLQPTTEMGYEERDGYELNVCRCHRL